MHYQWKQKLESHQLGRPGAIKQQNNSSNNRTDNNNNAEGEKKNKKRTHQQPKSRPKQSD